METSVDGFTLDTVVSLPSIYLPSCSVGNWHSVRSDYGVKCGMVIFSFYFLRDPSGGLGTRRQ